jgi:hypothetical protein
MVAKVGKEQVLPVLEEAYGTVRVYRLWPPIIFECYRTSFSVDGKEIGIIDPCRNLYLDFPVLTGYRNLKIVVKVTGAEKGKFIYLTTDGYIWDNKDDYDYKNF